MFIELTMTPCQGKFLVNVDDVSRIDPPCDDCGVVVSLRSDPGIELYVDESYDEIVTLLKSAGKYNCPEFYTNAVKASKAMMDRKHVPT